jgi:hypothetical protein
VSRQHDQLLACDKLRVRFAFVADRYAHEVHLADGADWRPLLRSVEGSPLETWPASPALQSLHIENRADGRQVALLVGMAGNSHWSASIELDPAAACARFDIACRVRAPSAAPLTSTYEFVPGVSAVVFDDGTGSVSPLNEVDPVRAGIKFSPSRQGGVLDLVERRLKIVAVDDLASNEARTVQWGYTLAWQES